MSDEPTLEEFSRAMWPVFVSAFGRERRRRYHLALKQARRDGRSVRRIVRRSKLPRFHKG